MPVRTVAQQWMGWTLPARCTPTAATLETRAKLMGATFQANEPAADPAPATPPENAAPEPAAPPVPPTPEAVATPAPSR
jgi:hypothetical protein